MAKKKLKAGYIHVDLADVAYESFSDMSYFDRWIPEGGKLVKVQLCHEPSRDYYELDQSYLVIEWKVEE